MNLVKWLRKNNKKIMAIVVIVILFGFIGGGALLQQLGQRRTGLFSTVAYFADNRKITNQDLLMARRELEILRMLRADYMLRSISLPVFRVQDLQPLLLGELLFADRRISPLIANSIKQLIRANKYKISDRQINDIYTKRFGSEIYWLMLTNEAQQAGVKLTNEHAGNQLARIIPQLARTIPQFVGATYSRLIGAIVKQRGISEEEILTTFGKFLAILEYARFTCSSEDVTARQIMHTVNIEQETIDVELVKFDSALFAKTQPEPAPEKIAEHFNTYSKYFAGTVTEENPYGFGYKLPDRVELEYLVVKLDDVSKTVTPPTPEQTEENYQKNTNQFMVQVPSDLNDPNSPLIEQARSYAEVAGHISKQLLQDKINSRAGEILRYAKALTEFASQDTAPDTDDSGAEQIDQAVVDYKTAAEQAAQKYNVEVYSGRTGLLSAADMQADEYLGLLYLSGSGYSPVGLLQMVFAIDELGASEMGPFDPPKPKLGENIGPLADVVGQIMAVVRVVKVEKSAEPESLGQTYSSDSIVLEHGSATSKEDIYSVRVKVIEDLKKLAAMDIAKSKAEQFIKQAQKDGWEKAVAEFNKLYGYEDKQEKDYEPFKLQTFTNLQRIPDIILETLAVQNSANPAGLNLVNEHSRDARFIDQLYSLVPQDANRLDAVPFVLEFKPDMSCYAIRNLSVKRLTQSEFEKQKALQLFKEDTIQSQNLAAVHINPENILKRMNFRLLNGQQASDANAPAVNRGIF
jgi:hypothetical protein